MYSVKQVADLSGVSIRTLRYYDEIELLKPNDLSEAGYREYTDKEIDRLQLILFYRELDLPLKQIKLLMDGHQDEMEILPQQRNQLVEKEQRLHQLIQTIDKTITAKEEGTVMENKEKFESFKQKQLSENEKNHGQEIREKYGEDVVQASNQKWSGLSEKQFKQMQDLETKLFADLKEYMNNGQKDTDLAQEIFETHRDWLKVTWPKYSAKAHRGLGQLYISDPRFESYYDNAVQTGAAKVLNEIIQDYAK
ncbi:MerR family transcriptional regulator [Pediococcus argentinicus]|uniref:MerR family transcriptional regulator n=1 Tax=Pediococcus argentinicus TaxID=480391 RepID=UPI00338DB5C7